MKLLALLGAGFSMSLRRTVAFRINLVFDVVLAFVQLGIALATVLVVFTQTDSLAGWSRAEVLVLIGTYQLLSGLKATFVDPNLSWFPETGIRNGRLDVYLLQPAPSLYLASLAMSAPLALTQVVLGAGVLGFGLAEHGRLPSAAGVLGWLLFVAVGLVITWALGVLLACLAFWAPKLQLDVFYASAWQLARYPVDIYRRPIRVVLTYVIPLALVASLPAEVLLRGPRPAVVASALGAGCAAAMLATGLWRLGLRRYTGATS